MKITVIGTGYVGLVTGACLSDVGVEVCCVDIDESKIEKLKSGILPIFEPGLEDIVKRNVKAGRLKFNTQLAQETNNVDAFFIAVGTPPDEDGSADMKYVLDVAQEIGTHLTDYAVVITKSTVPVGSAEEVRRAILNAQTKAGKNVTFDVASNPEFLKEGAAIKDFMHPDRIVVGVDNERAKEIINTIYKPFLLNGYQVIYMDIPSAEMTKYTANAMLATRISFMNDIANLCERVGANINAVRAGIGSDPRIGKQFLYAGVGYGGSCFPKDVKALIQTGKLYQHELELLKAVENVNERQKQVLFQKILHHFDGNLQGKKIAIWGLSFKPNTDDMREAPSLVIIEALLQHGVKVSVFDPVAMDEARKALKDEVSWTNSLYECAHDTDAIAIITEWNEFRLPDWERIKTIVSERVIFDGRNIYDEVMLQKLGFKYYGLGK